MGCKLFIAMFHILVKVKILTIKIKSHKPLIRAFRKTNMIIHRIGANINIHLAARFPDHYQLI